MTIAMSPTLIALALMSTGTDTQEAPAQDGWNLVWADEFNEGKKPDSKAWKVIDGNGCPKKCGFGNNELQTYLGASQNLRLEGGMLVIEAHQSNRLGFSSAKITTEKMPGWTYGKIEMHAKLPKGIGTWPAFWMMPDKASFGAWPKSGEIDIMEHVGFNEGHVHGTVHTEAYNHRIGTQRGADTMVADATSAFHTYGIEWTAQDIRWFIDGQEYFRFAKEDEATSAAWPYDQPFHIILNLAVGGDWGGKEGVDPAAFPARYEIDWVRVWQKPE